MSFRCQKCGIVQPNKTKPNRVIIEERRKVYPIRYADPEQKIIIDNGGFGVEIVKEMNLCYNCFTTINGSKE